MNILYYLFESHIGKFLSGFIFKMEFWKSIYMVLELQVSLQKWPNNGLRKHALSQNNENFELICHNQHALKSEN